MKKKPFKYPAKRKALPDHLKETMTLELSEPLTINVRAAKDQLSSLLEQAARGNEIVITSDGQPKAKLVPFKSARKPFRVAWELLRAVSPQTGARSAEEIVREERDGRP